jgi:hypothetical protein
LLLLGDRKMVWDARSARDRNSSADDNSHRSLHSGKKKTLKRYYAPIKMLITFQIWEQSTERSDVEMSNWNFCQNCKTRVEINIQIRTKALMWDFLLDWIKLTHHFARKTNHVWLHKMQ